MNKIFLPEKDERIIELTFELDRVKSRLRDLMFITAGLFFEAPPHHGIDVEDYLLHCMDNIMHDRPLMHDMNNRPKRLSQLPPIDQE
jgi:hypothetical protein